MVADELRDYLNHGDSGPAIAIRGIRAPDEPDLKNIGETAQWLLDHLLEKAGAKKGDSREARLASWKKEASGRHELTTDQKTALKKKYAGKIRVGKVNDMPPEAVKLNQLLGEWFPYGKSSLELLDIMGLKHDAPGCKIEKDRLVLSCMDEQGSGFDCVFSIREGKIEAVRFVFGY